MKRLDGLPTLRIDPGQTLPFTYGGKRFHGCKGDTIASALYANGVRIFGRSLKYHRPRGLYSLDGECSNTMMAVDGIPNVRCETTVLKSGMAVKAQNIVGSAQWDVMGFMDKLHRFMPAGFYYKTMHKPARIWPFAMKQIRKAAGLGRISPDFDMPGSYDEIFPTADVCVIGGGPAGMSAALAASESGLRVILLESRPFLGGFFDYRSAEFGKGLSLHQRSRDLADKIEKTPGIRIYTQTSMVGAYNNNHITAIKVGGTDAPFDEQYIEIRAESVVVATGCIERPLIFENNERPGVMQIACAHRLARTYGILAGERAVFSVGHDLGLEAAVDLFDLGMKITCVADIRQDGQNPDLLSALKERKIPCMQGWAAAKAHGAKQVKKVTLTTTDGTVKRQMNCDLIVASAGMTPVTGPLTLARAKLSYDSHTGFFIPGSLPEKMHVAGRLLGWTHTRAVEASGRLAGLEAAADCRTIDDRSIDDARATLDNMPGPERGTKLVTAPVRGIKSFICFDEDTTIANIRQAVASGFDGPELIKRYTSAGTGPGQGGIPGHNLPLYTARYQAEPVDTVRPTTVRPPLVPTFIATYAGVNHDMSKRTPVHDLQQSDGGVFRRIGVWHRARYFSPDTACREEIDNVRSNVGILDGSTLGKFRIHGPDALNALQRVYVSDMSRLVEGRLKYTAMCNDDGCVIDDGIVVKLGENDYYFTTSSGRAGVTVEWIRYHTRYDGWHFNLVNLTDAMGVINIAGPNARKVLEKVVDTDISNTTYPYGTYREFIIRKEIPVRSMRLGFVGELSYELHVPSSYMPSAWRLVAEAGKAFGIRNFGLEAQNVLRMEKGHIILGQESEQRTNLLDLGLGFLWDRTKMTAKTVGAVALRQAENDTDRLTLVGFTMEDPGRAPKDGSLVVDSRIRGYICTARKSDTLGKSIGMALVDGPLAKPDTRLEIFEDECGDNRLYARVVPMPFYDPTGKRARM